MQVRAVKRGTGLRQCRFEHPEISDAGCAAGLFEQGLVQIDDFAER